MKRAHVILARAVAAAVAIVAIAGVAIAIVVGAIAGGSAIAAAQAGALAGGATARTARSGAPTARAATAAEVRLRHTRVGAILTSSSGLTLYEFTRDRAGKDSCVALAGCAAAWPPLKTGGRPVAGAGVNASLLSTIRLAGGARQVTYAGHALYLFAGERPGETSYVGARAFGGDWDALSAAGHAVR